MGFGCKIRNLRFYHLESNKVSVVITDLETVTLFRMCTEIEPTFGNFFLLN